MPRKLPVDHPNNHRNRVHHDWTNIRLAILRRDSYTCQVCGGGAEVVHHKLSFNDGGDESPENLESLCRPCHTRKHTKDKLGPRMTITFENAELQKRVQIYTMEVVRSFRGQSEAICELLDFALTAKGY